MIIDLTDSLLRSCGHKPPQKNRYSVSSVWGILNGYTSVDEFLNGKPVDFNAAMRMSNGRAKHAQIQELLPTDKYEIEKKCELSDPPYAFTLVGRADFMDGKTVYEIKTTSSVLEKAKPWHIVQLKLYCTMFRRETGVVVQPVVKGERLILNELGTVKRNDEWFKKQMDKLSEFNERVSAEREKGEKKC